MIRLNPPKKRLRQQPVRKGQAVQYNRDLALLEAGEKERKASEKRAAAAERVLRPISKAVETTAEQSKEAPFTGLAYQEAAESQRQEKVQKWHDINTGFEAALMAQLGTDLGIPLIKGGLRWLKNKAVSTADKAATTPIFGNWVYKIPENSSMAYRRMGPLERDWLMDGNELSTRATNALTEAEEAAARDALRKKTRFNLFKAGADHGGRKQFAKGQPWRGTTVTNGKELVLAMPGDNLQWISGRHYVGPQGRGFSVGNVSFEEAPFGSHIDLPTTNGYSGVNPSLIDGSVIYSPFDLFGRDFGYKILKLTR